MTATRVLLVDDDEIVRHALIELFEGNGFDATAAANVPEALKLISSEEYDVLLTDLHMPSAGDGLTVINAMRHVNSKAITILLSSLPEMKLAAEAMVQQADQILLKPVNPKELVEVIKRRLSDPTNHPIAVESVATILEREAPSCIDDWFQQVQLDRNLSIVPLTPEQRRGHLPQVFRDLVARLRADLPLGTRGTLSAAAAAHGLSRRQQGYSAAMMVEESRILQVCIFHTLQNNMASLDFKVLLLQVMTIADEVDSQLMQAMECYTAESAVDLLPT